MRQVSFSSQNPGKTIAIVFLGIVLIATAFLVAKDYAWVFSRMNRTLSEEEQKRQLREAMKVESTVVLTAEQEKEIKEDVTAQPSGKKSLSATEQANLKSQFSQ